MERFPNKEFQTMLTVTQLNKPRKKTSHDMNIITPSLPTINQTFTTHLESCFPFPPSQQCTLSLSSTATSTVTPSPNLHEISQSPETSVHPKRRSVNCRLLAPDCLQSSRAGTESRRSTKLRIALLEPVVTADAGT